MIFAPIRPAILALIQALVTPLGDVLVTWKDQPTPYVPPGTKTLFKLGVGPASTLGWGDRRLNYDPSAPLNAEMTETLVEVRKFTLKILCECFDQTDGATAWNYLETVRTRLGWYSSVQALLKVNVAINSDGPLQDLSRTVDNRVLSAASYDVFMSTFAVETDTANPFGYIETIEGPTGTLT